MKLENLKFVISKDYNNNIGGIDGGVSDIDGDEGEVGGGLDNYRKY